MNKKFLSAILFGALMVTSTGTFVSCKDYDDDIDSINKELTDIKSQIAALQAKVDAGKWITSVSSTANGVSITLNDGQTLTIANGKDGQNGAQGAAGKDGSVVEVKEGVLYINGEATEIKVAEEAPAALPCVKVEEGELMVLGAEGEYVATGIKAGSVTAAKTNGVWTITIDGETIVVPGSAALTSIAIQTENKALDYNYGVVKEAVEWGWNKEETLPAGFYSRLSKDVDVLLNPADADGTAFTYTFKNSKGEAADVTFFGEARPSTAVLKKSRATSANGLWTLPAAVTENDATKITELRNELYLNFKENDGNSYYMTLEATDGLGNVAVRSDYDYTISLSKATATVEIDAPKYCLVGQTYYPVLEGAVYDYKIRLSQEAANLRLAKVFGVEITADGKGFYATNETALYNPIKFDVAYVTIGGIANNSKEFSVYFTNEMAVTEKMQAEALYDNFNAVLANNAYNHATAPNQAPGEVKDLLNNETDKVFKYTYTFDLTEQYNNLSDDAKLLWNQSIADQGKYVKGMLIGGESATGENYNALNRNGQLLNNIKWSINKSSAATDANLLTVRFYVSENWAQPEDSEVTADSWVTYSNFQLKTAYQLILTVKDPENTDVEVASIELPFEFKEPEIDVVGVERNNEGSFTKWASDTGTGGHHCDVLYMFGAYDATKFYLPMYDAFNVWTKAPYAAKNLNANAEYYTLRNADLSNFEGQSDGEIKLSEVNYWGSWSDYKTWANISWNRIQNAITAQSNPEATSHDKEASTYVDIAYDFYGVYPATKEQLGYYGVTNNYKAGFRLVFASTIQKSTITMDEAVYSAAAGSNSLFISNDDITATTMLGGDFVLFDGVAGKKAVDRAVLNDARGFNEAQRPFVSPSNYEISAKYANGDEDDVIDVDYRTNGAWNAPANGKQNASVNVPDNKGVQVFLMPATDEVPETAVGANDGIAAQNAGLYIVLGKQIEDNQPIELTIRVKDTMGFYNEFKVVVKKL